MAMPLYPLIKTLFPKFVTTTEAIGRAMIEFVASGASKPVLESEGINRLAADER
jgi:hypothetical protein